MGVPPRSDFRQAGSTGACLRKTFESHLLRSGADLTMTMLLMRHSPRGGMRLTAGVYADKAELLKRKRTAVRTMTAWLAEQRSAHKTRTATAS